MSREAMQMALEALESDPISHAGLVNRKQAITALRQALETDLARVGEVGVWGEWQGLTDEEIDALSQARSLTDELMDCVDRLGSEADTVDPRVWQHLLVYAPKPEEEPVAWISEGGDVSRSKRYMDEMGFKCNPLYTAPPKKEWVGLTNKEIDGIDESTWDEDHKSWGIHKFARAIEAKLREKNHG